MTLTLVMTSYEREQAQYEMREDEYVKKNKVWIFTKEQDLRQRFRTENPAPTPPGFPKPDHWY